MTASTVSETGITPALQFEVEQRYSGGLSLRGGYTLSRSINNFRARQDEFEPEEAKALADWHRSQTLFLTNVYELPWGKSLHGLSAALLKDWQVSSIFTLQSAPPFGVTVSADIANIGSRRLLTANRTGDGNLPTEDRTLNRWFDTAAFVQPAQYQFGNSGYNILEGDGIINLDLGLAKRWVMGEEHDVQFRVEFFNLANHANFGIPGGAVDSGAFGRVTSASTARQIQFGLRYRF